MSNISLCSTRKTIYKDPDTFSWENYLAETGASPAPSRAFKPRPPQGFKPGMKLEVVDKRVPFLIRVATIIAVKGHQVQVSFDGWPEELACWFDDDSPDLHPVGWCLKTGHPLEPPLTAEELRIVGPCGVGGCRGLGSVRGGAHKHHAAASACPYREPPSRAPDRLAERDADHALPRERRPRGRPPKHKRIEEVAKNDPASDDDSLSSGGGKRWRSGRSDTRTLRTYSRASLCAPEHGSRSSCVPAAPPAPLRDHLATHLAAHLTALALPHDPTIWTQSDVVALVTRIAGEAAGAAVAAARMSGAELVMASRDELVQCVRLRLGPAVKIYSAIRQLRENYT